MTNKTTPTTFPDALEGLYSILKFFSDNVEKLTTVQDSLCVAAVEAACKLRQTSMNDFFNVKYKFYLISLIVFSGN